METKNNYPWKFSNLGGFTRISLETGSDLVNLSQLDRKMWTVLSCPVNGLEFDQKTLDLLDTDADGKIRVEEVMAASTWLGKVLSNPDVLLAANGVLPLSALSEDPEAQTIKETALRVLSTEGLEKDSVSLEECAAGLESFYKTKYNGDGVITLEAAANDKQKAAIEACIKSVGAVADRSGADGVDAASLDAFYAACNDYVAWCAAGEADKAAIYPYGDNTAAALAAYQLLKDKIDDFFMRCKLVAFDEDATATLDMSAARLAAVSGSVISAASDEIAACPLARVNKEGELPLNGSVNPAWEAAFANLKSLMFDVEFPNVEKLTQEQWNSLDGKFAAYQAWTGAKAGASVEGLGLDAVKELQSNECKAELLALIEEDKSFQPEAERIGVLDKLLHFCRFFRPFLNNYVSFTDFYSADESVKAVFQVGRLYIDQRSCDLCIRVSDMGKHGDMAGQSGMYILYCDCVSKTKGQTMTIAAVLTDGDVDNLRVGQNAVFYDREGCDWDAVVTKIIDNPVSIRQAFWSPYKKLGRWITEKINKSASDKENAATGNLIGSADSIGAQGGEKKAPFDIAKFAGIFAAIGMALGMIASALVSLATGITEHWYNLPLIILAIIVCISGPSMFIAWTKLRKRNIAPVLNANGWAINAKSYVNITFGATLTQLAAFPALQLVDPKAKKKMPVWAIVLIILVVLGIVFAILYFTNNLEFLGLSHGAAAAVDASTVEAAAEAAAEVAPVVE